MCDYVQLCATMFITSIFFNNSCHRADLCGSLMSKRGSALCQQWHNFFCQYCYNESAFRLYKQRRMCGIKAIVDPSPNTCD